MEGRLPRKKCVDVWSLASGSSQAPFLRSLKLFSSSLSSKSRKDGVLQELQAVEAAMPWNSNEEGMIPHRTQTAQTFISQRAIEASGMQLPPSAPGRLRAQNLGSHSAPQLGILDGTSGFSPVILPTGLNNGSSAANAACGESPNLSTSCTLGSGFNQGSNAAISSHASTLNTNRDAWHPPRRITAAWRTDGGASLNEDPWDDVSDIPYQPFPLWTISLSESMLDGSLSQTSQMTRKTQAVESLKLLGPQPRRPRPGKMRFIR